MLRMFGSHFPLGPDWAIFEFFQIQICGEFCTFTYMHQFLLGIHPAWTCFRFRNYVDLTAVKLLGLILCSFCLALSSVLSLSKLPSHIAAKAFSCVVPPAISVSRWFSILMAMSVQTCGQSWTGRASCATP